MVVIMIRMDNLHAGDIRRVESQQQYYMFVIGVGPSRNDIMGNMYSAVMYNNEPSIAYIITRYNITKRHGTMVVYFDRF